jgi:thiol-disulfide isomerase/thioredoxin
MPLVALDGSKHNLNQYRGKWLVVNYWATWCPPCIAEMPDLQSFHDEHADKDAMVIGINAELISQDRLQTFLEDYFISYPVFMSKPGQQSELGLIPGLPTTFLVTPQGEVAARQIGPVTGEMIEQFIHNWAPAEIAAQ